MRFQGHLVAACAAGAAAVHQGAFVDTGSVASAALGVLDSIDEVMGSQGKALEVARSFVQQGITPGVEADLNAALSATVQEIAAKVDVPIKAGIASAQKAINAAVAELQQASRRVMTLKIAADQADHEYYECMDEEKGLLLTAESADEVHQNAHAARVEPCQLQVQRTKMSQDVPEAGFQFDCDHSMSGMCDTRYKNFQEHGQSEFAKLKASVQKNSELYAEAKLACEASHADVAAKKKAHETAVQDWTNQRARCSKLAATRTASSCSFGSGMQTKCVTELPQYNKIVATVKATGNAQSEPDRIQEWTTAHVTKCLLSGVVQGQTLDSALLQSCTKSVDYESAVGTMEYRADQVSTLLTPKQFTCAADQSISFKGSVWVVPNKDGLVSGDYTTTPFTPKLALAADKPAFDFCS